MRFILALTVLMFALVGCDKKGGDGDGYNYGRCGYGSGYNNRYGYGNGYGYANGRYEMRGRNICYDRQLRRNVPVVECQRNGGYGYGYDSGYGYNNGYGYGNSRYNSYDPYCRNGYNYGNYGYNRGIPYDYNRYGGFPVNYEQAEAVRYCASMSRGTLVYTAGFDVVSGQWYCVEHAVINPWIVGGSLNAGFHFRWGW